jgi:hypothetical protein
MNPFTMRSKQLHLLTATLACLLFIGCGKTVESYTSLPLTDYMPLQPGKYITYRLDSTVFTNFGTVTVVRSFQEKHVVDSKFSDATGRDSYRILRFTRDTAGAQPWVSAGTYVITPTDKTVEVIENNLRYIKLVVPLAQDYTWKGNRYLVNWNITSDTAILYDHPFSPLYSFRNDADMEDWDYTYSSIQGNLTVNGKPYADVITVDGINKVWNAKMNNATVVDPSSIAYVDYQKDNYAKGLGLIYQEFIMWEYQPPNGTSQTGYKVGFGVKRSILDHN